VSERSSSLLGYGLYFIDVLACLLFSITLALLGARFGHEVTVPVDLPRTESPAGAGTDVTAPTIALRAEGADLRIYLGDEPVTLEELAQRLEASPPPSVVVRSEDSLLSSVIAAAHAAGVPDIQLAYELVRRGGESR